MLLVLFFQEPLGDNAPGGNKAELTPAPNQVHTGKSEFDLGSGPIPGQLRSDDLMDSLTLPSVFRDVVSYPQSIIYFWEVFYPCSLTMGHVRFR